MWPHPESCSNDILHDSFKRLGLRPRLSDAAASLLNGASLDGRQSRGRLPNLAHFRRSLPRCVGISDGLVAELADAQG